MQTSDADHFFQTDTDLERAEIRKEKSQRTSKNGDPIEVSSKPLKVVIRGNDAWIAESGFIVRRLNLESGKTRQIYRGHGGPVTSLAFYAFTPKGGSPSTPSKRRTLLITGSWDKSVRIWDTEKKRVLSTGSGHADFVKTIHVIPSLKLLISGSSDKDVKIWDLADLESWEWSSLDREGAGPSEEGENSMTTSTPTQSASSTSKTYDTIFPPLKPVVTLKAHTRPVECLASCPIPLPDSEDDSGKFALFTADSMGALKIWEVWREGEGKGEIRGELRSEVRHHDTSIYDLVVGDGEFWTASADKSVLVSSFTPSSPSTAPLPLIRIPHPSVVKSLLPLSSLLPSLPAPSGSSYVLSGSTDENIRVWDVSELEPEAGPSSLLGGEGVRGKIAQTGLKPLATEKALVKEIEGHFHQVTSLAIWIRSPEAIVRTEGEGGVGGNEESRKKSVWIVSGSLDGTLRKWSWEEIMDDFEGINRIDRNSETPAHVHKEVQSEFKEKIMKKEGSAEGVEGVDITEDEMRELEELMGDE